VSETQIAMVVRMHSPAGSQEQVKAALRTLVEPSRREPGCLRYELYEDIDKPGDFILVERWRDQAALDEHFAKPYLQEFIARYGAVFKDAALTRLASL